MLIVNASQSEKIYINFQVQPDPYPPMSKNRHTSAPTQSRAGRPTSGLYRGPTITRDEKAGALSVTSSRLVRLYKFTRDIYAARYLHYIQMTFKNHMNCK